MGGAGPCAKTQRPVYFVSEVLTQTKARYPQVQKLLYTMLMATKKLQHYFTDHEVTIITSFPLGEVVRSRDAIGRTSKWALELMVYDIRYAPTPPSSCKPWPTSWPNGLRSEPHLRTSPTNTEPCTLMGWSWDVARGPA
jgi:hypothetical protein